MALRDFLSDMGAARRTVSLYSDDPRPDIRDRFDDWNVEVRLERLPEGTTDAFVTVRQAGEFVGAVEADVLPAFFEPSITLPGDGDPSPRDLAVFLDLLDRTLFHGTTRRQLLAATREFEDRAWRTGAGRLDTGFQRPAALVPQRRVYEQLADQGLDVHVYIASAWEQTPLSGVTVHECADAEVGTFWFLVYDDSPDGERADSPASGEQRCALLAEETSSGQYSGFWTYDQSRVDAIGSYIRATYC